MEATENYTNEILDKIRAAGIEVITDKNEYNRILEQENFIQKMAVSLSELENLNSTINNQTKNIQDEERKSNTLTKEEKILNEFSLNKFAEDIAKYEKFFPNNEYIKIANLEYEKNPYKNFELYIGKNITGHFVLSFTNENSITKEHSAYHDFYDIKNQRFQVYKVVTEFLLNEMNDVYEISKGLFAKKDYIPEIQDSLKNLLESIQSRQSDVLSQLIENNESKKQYLEEKVIKIKELEKVQARKTVDSWLYEAEEKAEDLWNKDQDQVKHYFANNDERKFIGIIPQKAMSIFNGIEDYHLYADKSYLIDHYLNRHHDNRLFENIQNVIDNYSNIYFDKQQNSIGFIKNYGTLADCLFVKEQDGKIILFSSTYNQPEHRLHSNRYKKITPAKKQEFEMSLEGSTPLSQNPEGNTAVAISDVNDNSILADIEKKSTIQKMVAAENTYGFVHNGKIYLNPEFMNSNAAVHEYTHLWDAYTQKTNPELWNKGLEIFKDTKYWNEVISDSNYQDIRDDENLVLSEIHARIQGDIAEQVLNRIAELDGNEVKLDAIDWDQEVMEYISSSLDLPVELRNSEELKNFMTMPLKDLVAERNIAVSNELSWEEIGKFFENNIKDFAPGFNDVRSEVDEENYETEREEKEEVIIRMLDDNLDWHFYANDGRDVKDDSVPQKVLQEKWSILEEMSKEIVEGKVSTFEVSQIILNDKLLHSDLYHQISVELQKAGIQDIKIVDSESKPYNFFVNDTANLDLGIGAEFEPVTGLTAEQAVLKYAELKEEGLSPYIGLNIPGDIVFDDKEGQGAGIFTETEGNPSFYIGDNFVKGLKGNDEHAQNVLAAYKELYENADKYILGVEKPNFVFDKEAELNRPAEPLKVYTFSPFGYEGTIVQAETELRPGIPAYDIVGIADSTVKESRERVQSAFKNSGLEMPAERILQSLSPADIKKDSPLDLAMALGILGQTNQYPVKEPVLALGELELSGRIRPVRGSVAAVNSAKAAGIKNIVCDPTTAELLKDIDGIKILTAESLRDVHDELQQPNAFSKTNATISKTSTVEFNSDEWIEEALGNLNMEGHLESIRAIEVAVAGKHNILLTGSPGCGKTMLAETLLPALTPKLTQEESTVPARIWSIAGLDSPKRDKLVPPFRRPHNTASLEGIAGGGQRLYPGEISLAHNGVLFLDEAAEFRTSVLQTLRVPLENRRIALSRAGRSTVYPADFQLAMAMNPCPCGCFGISDKICLCSARSIEMYWKKPSGPLLDRVEIKIKVEEKRNIEDKKEISVDEGKKLIEELKSHIATAYEIQRKRGVYNSRMTPLEIRKYCKLDKEGQAYLDKEEDKLTSWEKTNLLKLSLTIANMDGREEIRINDLKEARELSDPVLKKLQQFAYNPAANLSDIKNEATKDIHKDSFDEEAKRFFKKMKDWDDFYKPENPTDIKEEYTSSKDTHKTSDLSISENDRSTKSIPLFQAKLVKEAIENKTLFSPVNGMIRPEPVYNQSTGYQLEGIVLLEAQINKAGKNYGSNVVGTIRNINALNEHVKKGEHGLPVLFKGQDGSIRSTNYFFPEQTSAPEQVAQSWAGRIRTQKIDMSNKVIAVDRADAKSFLAAYFAATKMNAAVKIDEATAEAVKKEIREKIDETFRRYNSPIEKGSKIAVFNNLVFEAQKESSQIVKTFLPQEVEKEHPKEKKRFQEQER